MVVLFHNQSACDERKDQVCQPFPAQTVIGIASDCFAGYFCEKKL